MRLVRIAAVVAFAASLPILGATPAQAACHSFFFGDDPEKTVQVNVQEGDAVEVTVSRDAAVRPSSVRVQSVDGTAKAGAEYTKVDTRIEFEGESTQETVTVVTKDDGKDEPSKSLSLKLSEGQGCEVNTNFTYGPNAKVTIVDDDPAPKTATPKPIAVPTVIGTPSPSPSPSATPESTGPTASPSAPPTDPVSTVTETFAPPDVEAEDAGGFPWLPVLAVVGFLAAGGGALILTRLRRGGV
jgi:hypothetical protein